MKKWKAPGPDGIHGYWLKSFTSLHKQLKEQLNVCITKGCPKWMTLGQTVLLPKDKTGGTRPIACLPTTWKLLTRIISEKITKYLEDNKLIPEEQKGCRAKTRGCKDQLLIDQAILANCKKRKTNLSLAWIDFKKAYDSVSHKWAIDCMKSLGIANQWIGFLEREMLHWRTQIGNRIIRFKRGLFQGDSLAPLMFIICLIPISLILNQSKSGYSMGRGKRTINHLWYMDDCKLYGKNNSEIEQLIKTLEDTAKPTGLEFGIAKCATQQMERGKPSANQVEIELADERCIPVVADEGYKYLGMLQKDKIDHEAMKIQLKKEYRKRTKIILKKTKLNAKNTIKAINTWAVSVMRYSGGIVKWTQDELRQIDRNTRKLLAAERAFNRNSDVDRLYLPRRSGGKGLASVEEAVNSEDISLKEYVHKADRTSLVAEARAYSKVPEQTHEEYKKAMRTKHKQQYEDKRLHGQFWRETRNYSEASHDWLSKANLKRETEALIIAAQEQALRTNSIKKHIDKTGNTDRCRLCGKAQETSEHIVSACEKLAQKEYKRRHDKVASYLHWNILRNNGFDVKKNWYQHEPTAVAESATHKILWDFNIQTDNEIQARRPDIVVLKKSEKKCMVIDIAVPSDRNCSSKEDEKISKYQDLSIEIKRIWKLREVKVIPIVVGALGTVTKNLGKYVVELGMDPKYSQPAIQKSAILGTARILRRVLATPTGD
jgi:hypothetical protein